MTTNWLLEFTFCSLEFDRCTEILCHLFACKANKTCVKLKALVRLECNTDLLFRHRVDYTLMVVELKAIVENFLNLSCILASFLLSFHHLKFYIQVAV